MTRDEQFSSIEAASERLLRWANGRSIPLHRMEFVVPFVDTNPGLTVWAFFETDEQLRRAGDLGWPVQLAAYFTGALRALGYAPEWLPEVRFMYDSHEAVCRDYEGSYFYRLR
jgi:hypothetical protein